MPGKIVYENQGKGVVIIWNGSISGEGLKMVNEQIYAEGRLEKLRYQIWDFTNADDLQITEHDLRNLAIQDKTASEKNPNQIIAIVGSGELFNGYDRLFHIYEGVWSEYKSKTFSNMVEARKWISSAMDES